MHFEVKNGKVKRMYDYLICRKRISRIGAAGINAARSKLKKKGLDNRGFGTVEVVILIAVVVGIALLFRTAIIDFAEGVIDNMFPSDTGVFDNSAV